MTETVIASRKVGPIPLAHRRTLTTLGLFYSLNGHEPYFSVTGEIRNLYNTRGTTNIEACGCLHDEIAQYAPVLVPVIKVHLCDRDGKPLHAVENAHYWAGFGRCAPESRSSDTPATDDDGVVWVPAALARHLRVTVQTARLIRSIVRATFTRLPDALPQERWRIALDAWGLPARWKAEADAAMAVLTGTA